MLQREARGPSAPIGAVSSPCSARAAGRALAVVAAAVRGGAPGIDFGAEATETADRGRNPPESGLPYRAMTSHPPNILGLALVSVLAACGTGGTGAPATPPADTPASTATPPALTDRDLALAWAVPANQDGANFSEQLRVVVPLEGGGEVFTRLTVTNVAKFDGRAELFAKVELPDGRIFRARERRDRGAWTHGADRLEVRVGEAQIVGTVGRLEVRVRSDEMDLDYVITSPVAPVRPAGGSLALGGVFYTTTIVVPRGAMRGTLTIHGGEGAPAPALGGEAGGSDAEDDAADPDDPDDPDDAGAPAGMPGQVSLAGVAFAEHRATDIAPYRMARRWFKVSDVSAERTVVLSVFEKGPDLGGGRQGWAMITGAEGLEFYVPDLALVPRPGAIDADTGYELPAYVYFAAEPRGPRGIVRGNELSERRDDLARLSALERVVVRRLMKPWTFLYREADYLFKAPSASGVGERSWRGKTTFEYQQLNPE